VITMKTPREYQAEALCALDQGWRDQFLRQVVLLPTGTGKTFTAGLIMAAHDFHLGKILFVVHREELLTQTQEMLAEQFPHLTTGIVQGDRNETDCGVIIAMVQTLGRSPLRLAALAKTGIGLFICDEVHHSAAPTYRAIMEAVGCFENTRSIGLTATLVRSDDLGLGDVWQRVAYTRSIEWAEENGFLVKHRNIAVEVPSLVLPKVVQAPVGSYDDEPDYAPVALGEALIKAKAGEKLAHMYQRNARGRQGIVFTPTKAAALHVCDAFNDIGIVSEMITGETTKDDRKAIYARTRARETQVIVNVMVLTEGFDMPQLEVCVIARPTKSKSLYIQMVGRVKRPSEGKAEAIVLDTVAVTGTLPMKTIADLKKTGQKAPEPKKAATKGGKETHANGVARATYRVAVVEGVVYVDRTIGTNRVRVGTWSKSGAATEHLVQAGQKLVQIDKLERLTAHNRKKAKKS
jgi:ATP-dependent helicase IRC3